MFLTSVSALAALGTFSLFGHISGYKFNLDKSELFPLHVAAHIRNFPLKLPVWFYIHWYPGYGQVWRSIKFKITPLVTGIQQYSESCSAAPY